MSRHSRSRRGKSARVRRTVVAALGFSLAIGGGVYAYKAHKAKSARAAVALAHAANAAAPAAASSTDAAASKLPPLLAIDAPVPMPLAASPIATSTPLIAPRPLAAESSHTNSTPGIPLAIRSLPGAPLLTQTPIAPSNEAISTGPVAIPSLVQPASAAKPTLIALAPAATQPVLGSVSAPVVATVTAGAAPVDAPPASKKPAPAPTPAPAQPASASLSGPSANAAVSSAKPLSQAQEKIDAGDLLGARALLNDALLGARLSAADADAARRLAASINQTVLFSKKKFKDDTYQTLYQIRSGDRLSRIADHYHLTWELLCRINGLSDPRRIRAGQWIKIPNGPFHCVITKSAYRLDLYLGSPGEAGSLYCGSFAVGLGKDNSTPTGLWILQPGSKAHPATYYSPRGEGVMAPDDPKNPLGGYWLGLQGLSGNAVEKNSYGIHGTIEPDSIGKQASLGCIRLAHDDIAFLYDLLVDGQSKVLVKD